MFVLFMNMYPNLILFLELLFFIIIANIVVKKLCFYLMFINSHHFYLNIIVMVNSKKQDEIYNWYLPTDMYSKNWFRQTLYQLSH